MRFSGKVALSHLVLLVELMMTVIAFALLLVLTGTDGFTHLICKCIIVNFQVAPTTSDSSSLSDSSTEVDSSEMKTECASVDGENNNDDCSNVN